MFCNKCGKELPDGSKFCNYCGAKMPDASPRHARSDPEEIFSYSDENARSEYDVSEEMTKVYGPDDGLDQTKVYNFEAFEEKDPPASRNVPEIDEREIIDDSFDNYSEDDTFMDKMDRKFRRDDYDRRPQQNKHTWVWVVLGILAVVLIAVIAVLAVNGLNKNSDKNPKPTAATTATQKVTEKPTEKPTQKPTQKPTEAPKPTQAPQTEAPPTQAPETEAPPVTEAPEPETEAPAPEPEPETQAEVVEYY